MRFITPDKYALIQEVFLLSKYECIRFEKKLAFHSAPALLGAKTANLISLSNRDFNIKAHTNRFNSKASSDGVKIRILCHCHSNTLILLYNEKMLCKKLNRPEIKSLLSRYGYRKDARIEEYLDTLSRRISDCRDFPHEIGVFLDYPVEDIIGFIENKGKNFKMCGYWKVYSDTEYAKRTFEHYDKCRKFLCCKLNSGVDIYNAIKNSQEVFLS